MCCLKRSGAGKSCLVQLREFYSKKKRLILAMRKAFGIDAMAPDTYLTCTAITWASVRGYKYAILLSPLRFKKKAGFLKPKTFFYSVVYPYTICLNKSKISILQMFCSHIKYLNM